MKNQTQAPIAAAVNVPKAEAIEKFARHAATVKAQLEAAQAQLKTAVSPGKYALNFQVNALKKELHQDKAQILRLKKAPTV
jgi:hypothetical protein